MKLPWDSDQQPLMLAPMQGLTNRAMRAVQFEIGQPDVMFTEFVRVSHVARQRITASDRREAQATIDQVPLVVQLIGHTPSALADAAQMVEQQGAKHINLNMGCPFGRTTSGKTGGAMLQAPELLPECLDAVRKVVNGSLSVKVRAGYDNLEQIFDLLPLFEQAGIDFIVLHPRTVVQKYSGYADHRITARVVETTSLPVIANGDVVSCNDGDRVLKQTGAAGLMLGRGAIADPWLFKRLRGDYPARFDAVQRRLEICQYLESLQVAYQQLFCGEQQVLGKLKSVLECFGDADLQRWLKRLRRARTLAAFCAELADS